MDPANLSTAADAIPTAVEIAGDAAVGREVRGWFPTGLAKAAAPDVALLASGTQSSELATTAAAALKLAAAWDRLKLVPDRIHASLFGDGKLAFVTATVYLPRKTGPGALRMSVAIVATRTTHALALGIAAVLCVVDACIAAASARAHPPISSSVDLDLESPDAAPQRGPCEQLLRAPPPRPAPVPASVPRSCPGAPRTSRTAHPGCRSD